MGAAAFPKGAAMRAMGRLGVYLLVFVGLFGCASAWGQTNGEIRGTVNDPSGAVVPGATITATLTGTDTTRTVTSDKDGGLRHSRTRGRQLRRQRRRPRLQEVRRQERCRLDRPRQFHHRHVAARRWKPNRHGGSQRRAGGDHQHPARRSFDRPIHPRASAQHAQRVPASAASAWRAITARRGPLLRQRQSRASSRSMAVAAVPTTIW